MFAEKHKTFWTILGVLFVCLVIYLLARHTTFIENTLLAAGPWAPLAAIIFYTILAPTPITTDPITLIMGVTYGPLLGMAIAWIGNTCAALVEYAVGKRIALEHQRQHPEKDLPAFLKRLPVQSPAFLILGRTIPGYGGKIISILAGMHQVPLQRYIWTTALTNLLGSILLAYGGFSLIHLLKFP